MQSGVGTGWQHSFSHAVYVVGSDYVVLVRPDGKTFQFSREGSGSWESTPDVRYKVKNKVFSVGSPTGFEVHDTDSGRIEVYNVIGKLMNVTNVSGRPLMAYHDPVGLRNIEDVFGRSLSFSLNVGLVSQMFDPVGRVYGYRYDDFGNLVSVTYPDGLRKVYHYGESSHVGGGSLPNALTGVSEEVNAGQFARYSTFQYDSLGRAIVTQHAGESNRYQLNYPDINVISDI